MFRRVESSLPADFHFPPSLEEFGYQFNDHDQIRMIEDPTQPFNFNASRNERFIQRQRDAMNEHLRRIIRERHAAQGLQLTNLPVGTPKDKPHVPVFTSKDLTARTRVIVYFGESHQDHGVLSGRVMNVEAFNKGSTIEFVHLAHHSYAGELPEDAKPGIIIANSGQLLWNRRHKHALTWQSWYALPRKSAVSAGLKVTEENYIPKNRDVSEHVKCVFEDLILPLPDKCAVFVIAAGDTAHDVFDYLQADWGNCATKVQGLAILASNYVWQPKFPNKEFMEWFGRRARGYMVSQEPLGTPLQGRSRMGCNLYSGGEKEFVESVMSRAVWLILEYFKLTTIVPAYENLPQDFDEPIIVKEVAWGDEQATTADLGDSDAAEQDDTKDGDPNLANQGTLDQAGTQLPNPAETQPTFAEIDSLSDSKDNDQTNNKTVSINNIDDVRGTFDRDHDKNNAFEDNMAAAKSHSTQTTPNKNQETSDARLPHLPPHGFDGADDPDQYLPELENTIVNEQRRASLPNPSADELGNAAGADSGHEDLDAKNILDGHVDSIASNGQSCNDPLSPTTSDHASNTNATSTTSESASGYSTPQLPPVPHTTPEEVTPLGHSPRSSRHGSPTTANDQRHQVTHSSLNAASDALRRAAIGRDRALSGADSRVGGEPTDIGPPALDDNSTTVTFDSDADITEANAANPEHALSTSAGATLLDGTSSANETNTGSLNDSDIELVDYEGGSEHDTNDVIDALFPDEEPINNMPPFHPDGEEDDEEEESVPPYQLQSTDWVLRQHDVGPDEDSNDSSNNNIERSRPSNFGGDAAGDISHKAGVRPVAEDMMDIVLEDTNKAEEHSESGPIGKMGELVKAHRAGSPIKSQTSKEVGKDLSDDSNKIPGSISLALSRDCKQFRATIMQQPDMPVTSHRPQSREASLDPSPTPPRQIVHQSLGTPLVTLTNYGTPIPGSQRCASPVPPSDRATIASNDGSAMPTPTVSSGNISAASNVPKSVYMAYLAQARRQRGPDEPLD